MIPPPRSISLMVLALCVALTSFAHAERPPQSEQLREANAQLRQLLSAYEDDPDHAREGLQQVTEVFEEFAATPGFANADLLVNLAAAHLALDQHGRAIACALRARDLRPWHQRAGDLLAAARQEIPEWARGEDTWRHGASALVSIAPAAVLFWTAVLAAAATFAALSFAVVGRRSAWLAVAVPSVLVVLLCAGWLAARAWLAGPAVGVVIDRPVFAQSGPARTGFHPAFSDPLPAGAELDILEIRARWVLISPAEGGEGWLPQDRLDIIRPIR